MEVTEVLGQQFKTGSPSMRDFSLKKGGTRGLVESQFASLTRAHVVPVACGEYYNLSADMARALGRRMP